MLDACISLRLYNLGCSFHVNRGSHLKVQRENFYKYANLSISENVCGFFVLMQSNKSPLTEGEMKPGRQYRAPGL